MREICLKKKTKNYTCLFILWDKYKKVFQQFIHNSPFFGAGENPDGLSKFGAPSGRRPLACAFASSIASFFFSTLLSRSDKSTCKDRSLLRTKPCELDFLLTHRKGSGWGTQIQRHPDPVTSILFHLQLISNTRFPNSCFKQQSLLKVNILKKNKPFSLYRAARFLSIFLESLPLLFQRVKTSVDD